MHLMGQRVAVNATVLLIVTKSVYTIYFFPLLLLDQDKTVLSLSWCLQPVSRYDLLCCTGVWPANPRNGVNTSLGQRLPVTVPLTAGQPWGRQRPGYGW